MKKLRGIIEQHSRWNELTDYIDRIEASIDSDFSLALENAKSLIETIGKELCSAKGIELRNEDFHQVVKSSFMALGYSNTDNVNQISRSLATIALQIGTLRNQISPTSHGRTLDELKERNNKVDLLTREFLIDSTLVVAVFLIRAFEERRETELLNNPPSNDDKTLKYEEAEGFNDSWDESFGEFQMGDYSFFASEILYNLDCQAYNTEYRSFKANELELKVDEEP